MRKIFYAVLVLALCLSLGGTALQADAFASGSGTPGDPFIITTAAHLDMVRLELSAHHRLGGNITLAGNWVPIGTNVAPFTGNFNGNGHMISGLQIHVNVANPPSATLHHLGLFGVTSGATISNVTLSNVDIHVQHNTFSGNTGGLVGHQLGNCNITNSHTSGTIDIQNSANNPILSAGGLVGRAGGSITGSSSSVDVSALQPWALGYFGGLVGRAEASITNSRATGDITTNRGHTGGLVGIAFEDIIGSSATGNVTTNIFTTANGVGGLVGYLSGLNVYGDAATTVRDSYATGNVNATSGQVGGLIGRLVNRVHIINSFATGDVAVIGIGTGNNNVGGLVGGHDGNWASVAGVITTSHATGNVTGNNNVGGLVGSLHVVGIFLDFNITNSFATGNVSGNTSVGGLVGNLSRASGRYTYATGDVTGNANIGGLIGRQGGGNSSVAHSYAMGSASGPDARAIVGTVVTPSSITRSYRYAGFLVNSMVRAENEPNGRQGGILSMAQLQTQSTYENNNWLFNPVGPWALNNNAFPHLNVAGVVGGGPGGGAGGGEPGDGGPGAGTGGGGAGLGNIGGGGGGSGGGGGCNVAAGLLAMLLVLPLFFKKKK